MATGDYTGVKLYAYHEPDPGPDESHHNPASVELGAGYLVVGVEVEGVRVPLGRFKAGKFLQTVAQAKTSKSKPEAGG